MEAARRLERDGVESEITYAGEVEATGVADVWVMETTFSGELPEPSDRAWLEAYLEGRLDGLQSEHARLLADLNPTYNGGGLLFEQP
jgi:hypothetical protein